MGEDVSISELAASIAAAVGFDGRFIFDSTKPDGTPRKLLDTRRLKSLGWQPNIQLVDGLQSTYSWFVQHSDGSLRG